MKKFLLALFSFYLVFAEPVEDLPDYTSTVSMRNLYTSLLVSVTDDSVVWNIRQIVLNDELKKKDKLYEKFPFGWVQFYIPTEEDVCFAVPNTEFAKYKSCSEDLKSGELETIFSIMPTDSGAVHIRSLTGESDECLFVYQFAPTKRGVDYGLKKCVLTEITRIRPQFLIWILPPVIDSTVIPRP